MTPDYDTPSSTRRHLLQYGVCMVGTAFTSQELTEF